MPPTDVIGTLVLLQVLQLAASTGGSLAAQVAMGSAGERLQVAAAGVPTISVGLNRTLARVPPTHAGLIMEGVNHALYGYGLGSQMVFGEARRADSETTSPH